jgi:hypothetical protein
MSELDDLEAFTTPEPRVRNARERATMRLRGRMAVSDKEADLIYARALAEIRAKA